MKSNGLELGWLKAGGNSIKIIGGWEPGRLLRFGLVGDVPLAAQNPYPCSGVIFPKKGTHD